MDDPAVGASDPTFWCEESSSGEIYQGIFLKHSTTPVVLSNEFILLCVSDGKVLV
jgi:hypothetical protein